MTLRLFRVFVSSTFSDFHLERQALQDRVFPELERYCRERGARFQGVDLRWGISDASRRTHATMRVCLEEIDRCQRISPRPNFVALLGERYGWQPPPASIPESEWRSLLAATSGRDRALLSQCYRRDTNAVPTAWLLRPSAHRRERAVLCALRRAADTIGLEGEARIKYFASATHQEIHRGILQVPDATDHVRVYLRSVDGLPFNEQARSYCDWPDEDARARIQGLRQHLTQALPTRCVTPIAARWSHGSLRPDHIEAFCSAFLSDHRLMIDSVLATAPPDDIADEDGHWRLARARTRFFVGRGSHLRAIGRHVESADVHHPLLVRGEGGLGKSALLAQAALAALRTHPRAVIIPHFVGAIVGSETISQMLARLVGAIGAAYRRSPASAADAKDMTLAFADVLRCASKARPLLLFIDAVDQLSPQDLAVSLSWIPATLPPHVRIVLSSREAVTQTVGLRTDVTLLRLSPMSLADGHTMLVTLLRDAQRRISGRQKQRLLSQFKKSGSPLWLRLAFDESRAWHSWGRGCTLPRGISALVRRRIASLARPERHGEHFVRRATSFIAASRAGIGEQELAVALGTDAEVRTEFVTRSHHAWKHRLLPPILWSRLHSDLSPYITEAKRDGVPVYQFLHREFSRVILKDGQVSSRGVSCHTHLARTYAALPFADRQRLFNEMFHLLGAGADGDSEAMHTARSLIRGYAWVDAKLAAGMSADCEAEVARAASLMPHTDLPEFASFLRTHMPFLRTHDPDWPTNRVGLQLALELPPTSVVRKAALRWHRRGHCAWTSVFYKRPSGLAKRVSDIRWLGSWKGSLPRASSVAVGSEHGLEIECLDGSRTAYPLMPTGEQPAEREVLATYPSGEHTMSLASRISVAPTDMGTFILRRGDDSIEAECGFGKLVIVAASLRYCLIHIEGTLSLYDISEWLRRPKRENSRSHIAFLHSAFRSSNPPVVQELLWVLCLPENLLVTMEGSGSLHPGTDKEWGVVNVYRCDAESMRPLLISGEQRILQHWIPESLAFEQTFEFRWPIVDLVLEPAPTELAGSFAVAITMWDEDGPFGKIHCHAARTSDGAAAVDAERLQWSGCDVYFATEALQDASDVKLAEGMRVVGSSWRGEPRLFYFAGAYYALTADAVTQLASLAASVPHSAHRR